MIALFVLQANRKPEVSLFQNQIKQQVTVALIQIVGDGPLFDQAELVFKGVSNFYEQSANSLIALLSQPQTDADLVGMISRSWQILTDLGKSNSQKALAKIDLHKFMQEEPLYNIVPEKQLSDNPNGTTASSNGAGSKQLTNNQVGKFLGATTEEPVNSQTPWVTIRDNLTGQLYCLAIYNGEVNKYLGICKRDYH